jgi:hypothetical protein
MGDFAIDIATIHNAIKIDARDKMNNTNNIFFIV